MKMKYICLIFIILCLVILQGCANDDSIVMELKPHTNSNDEPNTGLSLINPSWQACKYKDLSYFSNVNMEVEEGSISPLGVTLVLKNEANKKVLVEDQYCLERKADDCWYELPLLDEYCLSKPGCELSFLQSRKLKLDWQTLYGKLEPGDYRIIKNIKDSKGLCSYNKGYLATEFAIE